MRNLLQMLRRGVVIAGAVTILPVYAALPENETVAHPHSEHSHLVANSALSLAEVFRAALDKAPEQPMTGAYQQQTDVQQRVSRSFIASRPRLSLSYWDDQAADDAGLREMEAGVEFDLWRLGERRGAQALAADYEAGSEAWDAYLKLLVAGRLRTVLHMLDAAQAEVDHARAALDDAEKLLAVSQKRFQTGAISRSAVMQSETLVLEMRQQLLSRQTELVDAERQYAILTGLTERPASVIESMPSVREIDQQHPQLHFLLMQRQQRADQLAQQRHKAAGNSTVSLRMRRERGSDVEPEIESLGVSVSIPFGGSSHTDAASSAEALALSDADVRVRQVRLQLQQQLHEVEHELDVLAESIDYATQTLELSKKHWQMANKAFAMGESDIRPTILALQQYRRSQLNWQLLQLRHNALISSYKQTVGELL